MTDLDVEAVEEIEADAPEYVLYGGKGGVGKTTMAAATGLASAAEGTRTLVVSTDPAHSLSDALGVEIDAEPTRIADDPAWGVEIDPDAAMAETPLFEADGSFGGLGGMGDLLDTVAPEAGDGAGLSSVPGTDEAAAVQQLLRFMDDDRFDRVVVDTAPTGHTLRLLELPDVMDSMVGRALKLRQTLGGVMDRVGGLFGGDDGIEGDDAVEGGLSAEEADDLEALQERIERLRGTLRDPARTDFRIVMVPEEMSVLESERLRDRLDAFGIPVGMVVVNRVMEDLADVADTAGEFVSPNLEDCAFCARRWEVQQDALAAAQDLFREYRVARVPLFAEEVRGEKRLRLVAACLAA
jgi:arsenite-transporting ATPase